MHDFDYTIKNALLWGNCSHHLKEAKLNFHKGNKLRFIEHACLAVIEIIPIITQVVSIAELIFKKLFPEKHEKCNIKGFLFEVKDGNRTIAYLCGSLYYLPVSCPGMNEQTRIALEKCDTVYFENVLNVNSRNAYNFPKFSIKPGNIFEIFDIAQDNAKLIWSLEDSNDKEFMNKQNSARNAIENNVPLNFDIQKNQNKILRSWQNGDEKLLQECASEIANYPEDTFKLLTDYLNNYWMTNKISYALGLVKKELTAKPVFIVCGALHLFDLPNISTGLITRIRENKLSVELVT